MIKRSSNQQPQEGKLQNGGLQKDYVWTFSTYFTEGFPYTIIRVVTQTFLRDIGVSLENVGVASLFGLPWTLKFLWGPWVDEYSTKRRWLLSMQSLLFIIFLGAALVLPLDNSIPIIGILFLVGSFLAATHDIAIDGYYMEALDKDGQAKFVGYRTMAFRIAWMTGTGLIVTIGINIGWFLAFLIAAIIFGLFLLFHLYHLKEVQQTRRKIKDLFVRALRVKTLIFSLLLVGCVMALHFFFKSTAYGHLEKEFPILGRMQFAHWIALLLLLVLILVWSFRQQIKNMILKDPGSHYSQAFVRFMDQEKIGIILSFIILLRFGEWAYTHMVSSFMIDSGVKYHIGWLSAVVGLPLSIIGAMLGGWMISRYSLKKVLWPFILAQNLTNIIYMFLAVHLTPAVEFNQFFTKYDTISTALSTPLSLFYQIDLPSIDYLTVGLKDLLLIAGTHGFDQFASGLGTAALMTYLMRICHKDFKAAHYAIGSGLMNITGPFTGVLSGLIAGWLGFAWLFGLSFLVSIPAMILIPFLPNLTDKKIPATAP